MHQYRGKMLLHTGSMFSGKTSSLWKDMNRFNIAGYKTAVFKPVMDTRYKKDHIVTHDNNSMAAIAVETVDDIRDYVKDHDVEIIGIDEVQFLKSKPERVCEVLEFLLDRDYTVVIAGLDMDFETKPFEIVKELMPKADYLTKHHAVCSDCGTDAWVSFRVSDDEERIQIGASESYKPLCRRCYNRRKKEAEAKKNQINLEDMVKAGD